MIVSSAALQLITPSAPTKSDAVGTLNDLIQKQKTSGSAEAEWQTPKGTHLTSTGTRYVEGAPEVVAAERAVEVYTQYTAAAAPNAVRPIVMTSAAPVAEPVAEVAPASEPEPAPVTAIMPVAAETPKAATPSFAEALRSLFSGNGGGLFRRA